jgi:hypothetical protein
MLLAGSIPRPVAGGSAAALTGVEGPGEAPSGVEARR